jgi:regulator of sirC expression with transglutaminase-like and TPR domain
MEGHRMFRGRLLIFLFSVIWCQAAVPGPVSRAWDFNLPNSGTYKFQVEHDVGTTVPSSTQVTYSITIGKETQTRTLSLVADHPYIPLIMDSPGAEKMRVIISGLPPAALKRTSVFVYDANSQFPGEYFNPSNSIGLKDAQRTRALLRQSDEQTDLAKTKLLIDKMVDPTVNVDTALQRIDSMIATIRAMPDYGAGNGERLAALQRYIYEAGPWNDNHAFRYDLDDPQGHEIKNKLLTTYIASKKGNCVTMPLLFVILGQRLGLTVTVSTAPKHLLVKFKSDEYGWINLEATSGANPARDVWIRQQNPMTDKAITNGVYLQPLTKTETVAEMATVVAENYFHQKEYEKAITIVDVILEYYPKAIDIMTLKGTAFGRMGRDRFAASHLSSAAIPDEYKGYFGYLAQQNQRWFANAEAMGWQEESSSDKQQYQQRIDQAREHEATN